MSDTPTPRTDEACADLIGDAFMSSRPTHGDWVPVSLSRKLERELAEAKAEVEKYKTQAINSEADYGEIENDYRDSIMKWAVNKVELREELTAHKVALERSKSALLAITSGHFYQSSCRGGEMERLMNQAIEALGGKQ